MIPWSLAVMSFREKVGCLVEKLYEIKKKKKKKSAVALNI